MGGPGEPLLIPEPHLPFAWQGLPPSIERCIGELVADACGAIAMALREYQDGGLRAKTKLHGGDLIARLYSLRQYMVGYWDFDAMARTYGKRVLRERYDDLSDAALDELVSWPLDLLAKVVRSQMN